MASASGGVPPYTFYWGGYNPESLEAGSYELIVTDDNLCQQSLSFLITEPSDFSLELTSAVPDCTDPNSGSIHVNVVGYGGPVELDWGGVDPDMVSAGEYVVVATDTSGCNATASVVVPSAEIPPGFELNGPASVTQGDSAAYYYEYTLGSDYTWSHTGAEEQQYQFIRHFTDVGGTRSSRSVLQETNQQGCVGDTMCMDVVVQDDILSVDDGAIANVVVQPTIANDVLWIHGLPNHESCHT